MILPLLIIAISAPVGIVFWFLFFMLRREEKLEREAHRRDPIDGLLRASLRGGRDDVPRGTSP